MSEQVKAKVLRTFLHDNQTVRRGDTISGSKAVIQQLVTRKLATSEAVAAEQPQGGSGDDQTQGGPASNPLLDQNANVVIAAVGKITNVAELQAALEAENAETGKKRATVVKAIEAAIVAAEQPQG